MKNRNTAFTTILLAIGFLALSPTGQAVSPAPDGGYPGGNTAEGQNALLSLTTGTYNTAVGLYSLLSLTDGNFCTGVGAGTLLSNTADENTATGAGALLSNTTGTRNAANGTFALFSNTTGTSNTATGHQALFSNTTGPDNTATGFAALASNTLGYENTAIGSQALFNNIEGGDNTAVGFQALQHDTIGGGNTANGAFALVNNINGSNNTASGSGALFSNTEGEFNTANGIQALVFNTIGDENTASGAFALDHNTTGNHNIAVGFLAGDNVTTANNVIAIGNPAADVSDSCFIGNIRDVTTANADAIPVLIDSAGQLGTASSSRRFKHEIKPMDKASEAILALRPVTFHYKSDATGTPQFGLIAEEVAEINPNLVVRDKSGDIYTVRYDAVNAMLLNEFLKEHHKAQELEATVAQERRDFETTITGLKKEMESIIARSNEQDAKIQKVSTQVELNQSALRTVADY